MFTFPENTFNSISFCLQTTQRKEYNLQLSFTKLVLWNKCVNVDVFLQVVSRDCSSLLQAHYRLDGHPHVNPIHEVLVGDKRVYLIFPRSHSDLHSYVRARKRLREHEARRLFRQMAETVAACHEQGIVLRDLKLRKFVFADPQR